MESSVKVKKPVEAIQCGNAFSLLQRKMYNVLLANAATHLSPEVTHRITMRHLCLHMGYRSHDYKTIKQKFRELRRMDIEWDIINEQGNKVWTNTSPLSLARIIEGEGICEYEFTPSLVPFLDRPAQYAKFSLSIQARFKSSYGLALYENCERYRNIGHTKAFDVPSFRKLMGVGEQDYLEFFALKRRVINTAIKEVNQHADFSLEVEYKKEGRQVVSLRFIMLAKKHLVSHRSVPTVDHQLLQTLQTSFAMNAEHAQKLLQQHGQAQVTRQVETILQSNSFYQGQIKNMAAYLKSALNEDYQIHISSKQVALRQIEKKNHLLALQQQREQLMQEAQQKYHRHLCEQLPSLLRSLAKAQKQDLLTGFETYIKTTTYARLYEKNDLQDILVLEKLLAFIYQSCPSIVQQFKSFDVFMQHDQSHLRQAIKQLDAKLEKGVCHDK